MKKSVKTKLLSLVIAGTMAISFAGIIGCSGNGGGGGSTQAKLSFKSACDSSMLGGIGLLNASTDAVQATAMSYRVDENRGIVFVDDKEENEPEDITASLTDENKKEILANLAIAQSTLNGGVIKTEVKPSDREGFENYYTISAADITGADKLYTFYYNSTAKLDEEEDEEEEEQEMSLNGIVIMDGEEYEVTGEKSIEGEESELSFEVKMGNNYVIIEQEVEGTETEFSYASYVDGKLVYESEVEYEINEKGDVELEFEMNSNGEVIEYSYEFFKDGELSMVKVEMLKGGKEMEALIKVSVNQEGKAVYEFIDKNADKKPETNPDVNPDANADANADAENEAANA